MNRHLRVVAAVTLIAGTMVAGPSRVIAAPHATKVTHPAGAPRPPSSELPTFGRPTILGIQGTGEGTVTEVSLRMDTQGRIYAASPQNGYTDLWRSLDGGKSFKWVPAAEAKTGQLPTCGARAGGDDAIATDSSGRLYLTDYYGYDASAYNSLARSDDHGATFISSCHTLKYAGGKDRPWYGIDGDPMHGGNIFLGVVLVDGDSGCEGNVKQDKLAMARSPIPGKETDAGILFGPLQRLTGRCQAVRGQSDVQVSPVSHRAFMLHKNAFTDDFSHTMEQVRMARCEAVPSTEQVPSGLKCVDRLVASMPGFQNIGIPALTIDRAGNLFAVWSSVPLDQTASFFGDLAGDVSLYWSSSSDDGESWSPPVLIPTPGLHNSMFPMAAAGDAGRVDVAWFGTDSVDPDFSAGCGAGGPADVSGDWSLYFTQTLNGLDPGPSFSSPVMASEHFIHRGGIARFFGELDCAPTVLGDFFQMQVGPAGEALISYADSNSTNGAGQGLVFGGFPHAMFVRQNGGPGVLASNPIVQGDPAATNSVTDPAGDATYDANGSAGHNQANLDILGSSVSRPDADHYRVTIQVADLTTLAPDPSTGNSDTSLDWLVQWFVPSLTDPDGGKNFFAYMESTNGETPKFWDGEGAGNFSPLNGGIIFTYPGHNQITGSYTPTAPGTISIDVPVADVTEPGAIDDTLYNVTASTMTLAEPANTVAPYPFEGYWAGGSPFNLIESAPSFDFIP